MSTVSSHNAVIMADTRCANPAYQLDVDIMILEYVLYHAIKCQLAVLTPSAEAGESPHTCVELQNRQGEAARLVAVFDGV